MRGLARVSALVACAFVAAGCRQKPKPLTRTEPWLASARGSASAAPRPSRVTYRLAKSSVDFELPAKRATPKGRFVQARGELDVDLDDLSHTTGSVSVDLRTLELRGSDGLIDGPNTARGLDWLELGAGVAPAQRDTFQDAVFRISSLDAGHVVAAPAGDRSGRRRELLTAWAVKGELSLHGVRAPQNAEVSLTLVPAADPAAAPAQLLIRTRRPFVVELGTHDIRPREGRGVPISKEQPVLGELVGRTARVTFDLTFVPRE